MKFIKTALQKLSAVDVTIITFLSLLTIANAIFSYIVPRAFLFILLNFCLIALIYVGASLYTGKPAKAIKLIHWFYPYALIFITFKELYNMIKPLRPLDYDWLLMKIDHHIFGFNPTWMLHNIANPVLTEILQISYTSFYIIPFILALFLYCQKQELKAEYVVFSVVYGFFLSYIAYFLLPAVGPRFTLHDFARTDETLGGLWITPIFREWINSGESIPHGTLHPATIVQRDVFPSGHTMMTAIVMYLSVKFKSNAKYIVLPLGSLLIFSTVYLRYHYVIDVIAGMTCMVFSVWSSKKVFNYYQRLSGRTQVNY
jgi:membrane-associated phospholipid phosphatase